MGAVISNSWSVGGDSLRNSVNLFNTQPFINYNIPKGQGCYLTSSPIITADWNAPPGQKWTVPVGGGIGRVFKAAGQAFNAQAQAFYNVIRAGPNSISTPGTGSSGLRCNSYSQIERGYPSPPGKVSTTLPCLTDRRPISGSDLPCLNDRRPISGSDLE